MTLGKGDRVRDLYATPLGRDIVDKILLQSGAPASLIRVAGPLRLSRVERLTERLTGPGLVDTLLALVNQHPGSPSGEAAEKPADAWWREAVFYQVYPRSFQDSDGDGIGDLRGILSRLDYLAELGVDCLWLSPIFASPNQDMGYDVSDYRDIMAEMGTLADADDLIAGCHKRGMRIILDLVVNHTSAQHEWFRKAVADPDGPYGDYYFLRPPQDGEHKSRYTPSSGADSARPERIARFVQGTPPNNWTSFFSGPAWRWIPEAERWALHLFADHQMDLNWANPAVRDEVADIVRWWLDRGVDGFRLDVINYISKAEGLPDGNPFVGQLMEFTGVEHYFYGPRLDEHLRELRREGFTRPDGSVAVMVGETPGIGIEGAHLLSDAGLDLAFNFDVLDMPGRTRWHDYAYDLNYLKRFWLGWQERLRPGDGIALFLDNHDNPRMLSKVAHGAERDPATRTAVAKLLATLQLTMRGTPFLFQGQELAAVNQDFAGIADLRDVESLNRYRELLDGGKTPDKAWAEVLAGSRDHARVPMRWGEAGSGGDPWLAGKDDAPGFTAAAQRADRDSVWHWYRSLIALRRAHPALTRGSFRAILPGRRDYLGYVRELDGETWLIEANLSPKPHRRPRHGIRTDTVLGDSSGHVMRPWESAVGRVSSDVKQRWRS
ncbi:MAG TPA: alpha-glucosidase [Arachnia sp.]|nr:alpha-glucosidase [Arachnia sp.]HMT85669.1 alpha-glucosidase [Arachnia sp.]